MVTVETISAECPRCGMPTGDKCSADEEGDLQDIPTADEDDASSEDSDREPLLHEGESEDEIARDDDDSSEVPSLEDNATDDSDDSSEPLSLVRLELEDEYGDNYDDLSGFPCLVELENEEENSEDYEDLSEVHPLREAEAEDEESVEWGEIEVEISAHLPRPLVANEINGPGVSVTVLHGQALDTDWTSAFPQCQEFDGIGGLSATLRRLGIHVPVRARLFLR